MSDTKNIYLFINLYSKHTWKCFATLKLTFQIKVTESQHSGIPNENLISEHKWAVTCCLRLKCNYGTSKDEKLSLVPVLMFVVAV